MKFSVVITLLGAAMMLPGTLFTQSEPLIFTPNPDLNRRIASKPLSEIPVIRYEVLDDQIILDPRLPSDWYWIAGRGIQGKRGVIEFFFHNGIFFSNSSEPNIVSFRARRYPDLFTQKIKANTFVIGMQKVDEGVVFAATEESKEVEIVIDKSVFNKELTFRFRLEKGQSRLIRILRRYPPYMP